MRPFSKTVEFAERLLSQILDKTPEKSIAVSTSFSVFRAFQHSLNDPYGLHHPEVLRW
jgi:hypothetical protein